MSNGALQNHDFVFDFIRRGSSLHRRDAFCHRHPFGRNGRQQCKGLSKLIRYCGEKPSKNAAFIAGVRPNAVFKVR
jgi:hypothetical protein